MKKTLIALWAGLFIVCAVCGFIPGYADPVPAVAQAVMTGLAVCFFLPPAVLVYRASREGDRDGLKRIRNVSALSLGLTVAALILNFLSALTNRLLGDILFAVLVVVSSPMVCSGYWALSLFLWASLLMTAVHLLKKK